jgi:hypothetical protein
LFLFLLLAPVLGCGSSEKQVYANVKGTVTFNGQPIEKGQITFSIEGKPPSSMDIIDGQFSGQALVGSNRITVSAKKKIADAPKLSGHAQTQIEGYQKKFARSPGEGSGAVSAYDPTLVEYIPPEWGTHSAQMRVVEAGAANDFQFAIRSSN